LTFAHQHAVEVTVSHWRLLLTAEDDAAWEACNTSERSALVRFI
jgi:hypothetical protein